MYQFNKVQDGEGTWRFELDGINLLLDGFFIKDGKHWLKNPTKAIAFFSIGGHLYGVANQIITFPTAEDFYDTMLSQYHIFKNGKAGVTINNAITTNTKNSNNNHYHR